jgi:DNA-binding GntR family transcriptional regulator
MTMQAEPAADQLLLGAQGAVGSGDAVERAYQILRLRILDGSYPPASHLTELALSADLGLSRTAIRQALRRLSTEGLVEIRANRGAFVSVWSSEVVADIAQVRAHLAVLAGRLAATRLSARDMQRLSDLAQQTDGELTARAEGFVDRVSAVLLELHGLIFVSSGNRLLSDLFRQTTFVPVVYRTFHHYEETDWSRIRL